MVNAYDVEFADFSELMRKHHEESAAMAVRLSSFPAFRSRADRMSKCGTYTRGLYCPKCKSFHTLRSSLCRDRLCPNCGWALSRRRARAVLYAVDRLAELDSIEVLHLVLTLRHDSDSDLASQIDELLHGFRRFIRYPKIRKHLLGYVRSVEIKSGNAGFHPHIHVVLVMSAEYFKSYITQADFVSMWRRASKVDYDPIVWIEKAYDHKSDTSGISSAIYECVKYTIKTSDWFSMSDDDLAEAAKAIHSRTLFYVCGRLLPYYKDSLSASDTPDEMPTLCKRCGSQRSVVTINI